MCSHPHSHSSCPLSQVSDGQNLKTDYLWLPAVFFWYNLSLWQRTNGAARGICIPVVKEHVTMPKRWLVEPDILECEVKWALESTTMNKASGGDDIPVELFQILKDNAVKVLHSICQQIWKTQQWPQDWKRSVFIQRDCQRMLKLLHNCTHLTHTSHIK